MRVRMNAMQPPLRSLTKRRSLGGVERARQLGGRLVPGHLELPGVRRLLELRLEPIETLLCVRVPVARVPEVLPDEVEVLAEAPEVLLQLGAVGHHLRSEEHTSE